MAEAPGDRDSIEEIVSDLEMYYEDGEPIEVWFVDETPPDHCEGFVATIGTDYVLIARLHQRSWLNGLRAIRLTAIKEILPADDEAFVLRALRARCQPVPPVVPFRAQTLEELLGCVCAYHPIVVLDNDPDDPNASVAGTITEVRDGLVRLREMSRDGYWLEGTREVALQHVENVFFASQYEETLRLIGELPDAGPRPRQ